MRRYRFYMAVIAAVLIVLAAVPILIWDAFLAERLPRVECQVYGRTAERLGLPEGANVSLDSGDCLDRACAVETRTVTRVVFSDSRTRTDLEADC